MQRRRSNSPSKRRHRAAYRERSPFERWLRAAVGSQRVKVTLDEPSQRKARHMIAAGWIAYENRGGLLRDIAPPCDEADAGRVFRREASA